jgi:hypothetical protein
MDARILRSRSVPLGFVVVLLLVILFSAICQRLLKDCSHIPHGRNRLNAVPAVFHSLKTAYKVPVYVIPDGDGGWLESAPQAHNNYIIAANTRSGGNCAERSSCSSIERNARTPSIPMSSIHLELVLAGTNVCAGAKGYSVCLRDCFALMHDRKCRGLNTTPRLGGHSAGQPQRSAVATPARVGCACLSPKWLRLRN